MAGFSMLLKELNPKILFIHDYIKIIKLDLIDIIDYSLFPKTMGAFVVHVIVDMKVFKRN